MSDTESGLEEDNAGVDDLDSIVSTVVSEAFDGDERSDGETVEDNAAGNDGDEGQETDAEGQAALAEGEQDVEVIDAPEHWSAEQKAAFSGLSNDAKQVILEQARHLEGNVTRKSQALSNDVNFATSIRDVLSPLKENMNRAGMDEVATIKRLISHAEWAQKDPLGYIQSIASQSGIDLNTAFTQAQEPGENEYVDPIVKQQGEQLQNLQSVVGQFLHSTQQAQEQQAEAARTETVNAVTAFESAKDENGGLKYPHFATVRHQMAEIVRTAAANNQPMDLEQAYDQAVWANPSTRSQMIEATQTAVQEKNDAEREAAVEKAKQAARNGGPGTGAKGASKPSGDLDSIIDGVLDTHL